MKIQSGPIKDFVDGIYDGPHATPPEASDGPIFLGIRNVTADGRLDFSETKYVSEQDFPKWTKRVTPQQDDLVFSYEATLHRYAIIPADFRGCLGRRMGLVRVNRSAVEPKFLLYYFLSKKWRAVIDANIITGATVDRIPLVRFPEFEIEMPDLPVQRRIASILSAYDDLIENNRRRIHLLEQSARLLYKEWFVHLRFPGHERVKIKDGMPEGWERKTAAQVMDILSGGTPKTGMPDYWDGEIPFFTPKDAVDEAYVFKTEKHLTDTGLSNCSSSLFPRETIFFTARGTVGNINLAGVPMAMNQSCYALVGKPPFDQLFLFYALKESVLQFKSKAGGAVFDAIVKDTFNIIPFVAPSASVIGLFSEQIRPMLNQVYILISQNSKLSAARDLLLPKLMNGEVVV